jgi:uncharacterized protein with NRDE domain
MCLILFAYQTHPDYELVLAGNRDEFYTRPTQPMAFWDEQPELLAGRDLEAGGTWLGITRQGRFATVTNYRQAGSALTHAPSRGHLVSDFLSTREAPEHYLDDLAIRAAAYNGFNLLLRDRSGLFYYTNRGSVEPYRLAAGVYGLSNHLLDTPWPKVVRGKQQLSALLAAGKKPDTGALLALLENRLIPDDSELPDSGVGLDRERMLAPMFIETASYGTRSSTVLTIDSKGTMEVCEKTHADGSLREFCFRLR